MIFDQVMSLTPCARGEPSPTRPCSRRAPQRRSRLKVKDVGRNRLGHRARIAKAGIVMDLSSAISAPIEVIMFYVNRPLFLLSLLFALPSCDLAPKKWTPNSEPEGSSRTMFRWASPVESTAASSRSRP